MFKGIISANSARAARNVLGGHTGSISSISRGTRSFTHSSVLKQVQEITSVEDYKTLISQDKVSVIDFYATWCGPCRAIEPIMEQLSEKVPQATFARVDVDQQTEIAQENEVTAMPTFKFYKNGEAVGKIIGANLQGIVGQITQHTGVDITKQ